MDSNILQFEFKNITRWTEAFEAYCNLEATKSSKNVTPEFIALSYVKILNFNNDKFRKLYSKYKRGLKSEQETTVESLMTFLKNELAPVKETKSAEVHSRIMRFRFKVMNKSTFDSLNALLDDYLEVTGHHFDNSLLCMAIAQALPPAILEQVAYNNTVDIQKSNELLSYVEQLCNRAEKLKLLTSSHVSQGQNEDIEMNFHQNSKKKHNPKSQNKESTNPTTKPCFNCGKPHKHGDCPAQGSSCNKCGKLNHFASVCRSSQKKSDNKNKSQKPFFSKKTHKNNYSFNKVENVSDAEENDTEDDIMYLMNIEKTSKDDSTIQEESYNNHELKIEQESFTISCIVDTGCTKALFPKSLSKFLRNKSVVKSYISTATTERQLVEQEEGDLVFQVKDKNDLIKTFSIRGSVNKIEGRLLLPAPEINTTQSPPHMIIMENIIPIYIRGLLWEVDIKVIMEPTNQNNLVNDVEENKQKLSISVKQLRSFNINPLNALGEMLDSSSLNQMAGLFIQVMHVRTGHFSARLLTEFFKQHHVEFSESKVKSLISNCKVCNTKTTLKKPKPKAKSSNSKRTKKVITLQVNDKDDLSSSSSSSSSSENEEEVNKIVKRTFNHILYQDCITLPQSINKNTKASVIIDYYSSYCSILPISTANSKETAQHLLQWIERFGKPFSVQTDNGSEFDGNYEEVLYSHNILKRKGVVARPEHQGIVERLNRDLRQHIDLFLQARSLPDTCWEWGVIAFEYNHNRVTVKNDSTSYQLALSRKPKTLLWPGDRVCFKPRNKDDKESSTSEISKKVIGTFIGKTYGNKSGIMVFLPNTWTAHYIDSKEVKPHPITLIDCIRIAIGGYSEPNSIDLAVKQAMMELDDPNKDIILQKMTAKEIIYNSLVDESAGKTHLEVSTQELKSGSHDAAIVKELKAFVDNKVFGKSITREQAKQENYEIVSFKGIPTWKLKDGKRVAKWRGVCRGFQDKWIGDVDTDAPTPSMIRTCFTIGISRNLKCAYADATTAFLQVDCPPDRKVAVVFGNYIPKEMLNYFKPGGIYILKKMLYGLKDSPRKWTLFLKSNLESLSWTHKGWGIFTRKQDICLVYYDDICIFSQDPIKDLQQLAKSVKLDEPLLFNKNDEIRYIGCKIIHKGDHFLFDISDYCRNLSSALDVVPLKPTRSNSESIEKMEGDINHKYLMDIGKIGWISAHHHSTCFSYSYMSRFSRGQNEKAMKLLKWIVTNIKNSPPEPYKMMKVKEQDLHLVCYSDASLSKNLGEAQLGILIKITSCDNDEHNGDSQVNVINFKSMKFRRVVRSTGQAELAAFSLVCDEMLVTKSILTSINCKVNKITIMTDSKVVQDQLKNPNKAEIHSRNMARFVSQIVEENKINVVHVSSHNQLADPMTKFIF